MEELTKKCSKCGHVLPVDCFYKDKQKKDGLRPDCKDCVNKQHHEYYETHKEERRAWQDIYDEENSEHLKAKAKEYREVNKEQLAEKRQPYFDGRKPQKRLYDAEYRTRPHVNEKRRTTHEIRMAEDIQYALRHTLRGRFWQAIKMGLKSGSAVQDLGSSIEEFKKYLESKFQPGMTWENRGIGKGKWHIDHIIPLSAFDLTQRQHVILACYYMNLQPLWEEENLRKHDSYPI